MANPEFNGRWFNIATIEFVGPIEGIDGIGGRGFEVHLTSGKSVPLKFDDDHQAKVARASLTAMMDARPSRPA